LLSMIVILPISLYLFISLGIKTPDSGPKCPEPPRF
jgi:hypothetical protein